MLQSFVCEKLGEFTSVHVKFNGVFFFKCISVKKNCGNYIVASVIGRKALHGTSVLLREKEEDIS